MRNQLKAGDIDDVCADVAFTGFASVHETKTFNKMRGEENRTYGLLLFVFSSVFGTIAENISKQPLKANQIDAR